MRTPSLFDGGFYFQSRSEAIWNGTSFCTNRKPRAVSTTRGFCFLTVNMVPSGFRKSLEVTLSDSRVFFVHSFVPSNTGSGFPPYPMTTLATRVFSRRSSLPHEVGRSTTRCLMSLVSTQRYMRQEFSLHQRVWQQHVQEDHRS